MLTIVGILTFVRMINFMLSEVDHEQVLLPWARPKAIKLVSCSTEHETWTAHKN